MTREAELRAKALLILPPSHFKVVRLFFLTFGFSFWTLLLVKYHGFGTGEFRLCIGPFRKNDEPQGIGERGADQFERVLRIPPRGDALLLCVICDVRP